MGIFSLFREKQAKASDHRTAIKKMGRMSRRGGTGELSVEGREPEILWLSTFDLALSTGAGRWSV